MHISVSIYHLSIYLSSIDPYAPGWMWKERRNRRAGERGKVEENNSPEQNGTSAPLRLGPLLFLPLFCFSSFCIHPCAYRWMPDR